MDQDQVRLLGATKEEVEASGSLPGVYEFLTAFANAAHLSEASVKESMRIADLKQVPLLGPALAQVVEQEVNRLNKERDKAIEETTEALLKVKYPFQVAFLVVNGMAESFADMAYNNPDKVSTRDLVSSLVAIWMAYAAAMIPVAIKIGNEDHYCPMCGQDPSEEDHTDFMLRVPFPGEVDEDEINTDPEAGDNREEEEDATQRD